MPHTPPTAVTPPLLWDVFCRVIDNFGDIGVCWRLCADLAARGHTLRLWVDDASALHWIAPGAPEGKWPGVTVNAWEQSQDTNLLATLPRADVWVEAFGCDIAPKFIAASAHFTGASGQLNQDPPVWINLEYLSAEGFVERSHGLPSPIMNGPAKGWTKHFYYPGFTQRTGGLLRESDLLQRQQAFELPGQRANWLAQHSITWTGERLVSLFCYEPLALAALLQQLENDPAPTHMLVADGRAQSAVRAVLAERAACDAPALRHLQIHFLPRLSQQDFDHLLWACDLNCVRGEDSLVRALWAGKPLVWQIYPQDDAAHVVKLDAFLDWLGADATLRAFHHAWNQTQGDHSNPPLPLTNLKLWSETVLLARQRLLQMNDLSAQLTQFVRKKR